MERAKVGIIVVGAGSSHRYGNGDKLLELLQGMPIFLHSLKNFASLATPGNLIMVTQQERINQYNQLAEQFLPQVKIKFVSGGETRSESVANGIAALDNDCKFAAIHDAARPLTRSTFLEKLIAETQKYGAVIAARPESDSLKQVNEAGEIIFAPDRSGVWRAETPQVFRLDWLKDSYAKLLANETFTDDAEVVRHAGYQVRVLQVDHPNPKLTYIEDLKLITALSII